MANPLVPEEVFECIFQQSGKSFNRNSNHEGRLASSISSKHCFNQLVRLLCKYIPIYQKENGVTLSNLEYVRKILTNPFTCCDEISMKKEQVFIKWMPKYKCALVAVCVQGSASVPMRHMELVALQNWALFVKRYDRYQSTTRSSISMGHATINIELVNEDQFHDFLRSFERVYEEAITKQTHQMTPSFIEMVLKNTRRELQGDVGEAEINIQNSGWSNVKDFVGGDWPLISAVAGHLLNHQPLDHQENNMDCLNQKFFCHFELWLLEMEAQLSFPMLVDLKTTNFMVNTSVDKIMVMMSSVAHKAADISNDLEDINGITDRCIEVRAGLDSAMCQRLKRSSEEYILDLTVESMDIPSIHVPPPINVIGGEWLNLIKKIARGNIELFLMVAPAKRDIPTLLKLISLLESHKYIEHNMMIISLVLQTVESMLFDLSSRLHDLFYHTDALLMEQLVYAYRLWSRRYLTCLKKDIKTHHKPMLIVEVISKELLVVWVAFCLIHKSMKQTHPLITEYGVPLKWKHIRHLVLSSKWALLASLNVCEYLKKCTVTNKELFSLSNQESTLKFAVQYATGAPEFVEIWQKEKEAADEREEKHWNEVAAKQVQVRRLQEEVNELESELSTLLAKRNKLSNWEEADKNEIYFTNSAIREARKAINNKRYNLKRYRKPPQPVFQPLPKRKSLAMKILFFLHMPAEFEILCGMSIAAQQMLLPQEHVIDYTGCKVNDVKTINEAIEVKPPDKFTDWKTHYNSHNPSSESLSEVLQLYSNEFVPQTLGPLLDVMDFTDSHVGVWYPDNFDIELFWNGGKHQDFDGPRNGAKFLNPFAYDNKEVMAAYFTEHIDDQIQWTLFQYGKKTQLDRGNRPISEQAKKPEWLSKEQWLVFASLRAFPYQQLRKLCNILCDRTLPLDHPHVHTLIRQTLYHTGDVSEKTSKVTALWKRDLFDREFCEVIQNELTNIAEELASKPQNHASLLILIEIVNYLSHWNHYCLEVCRAFLTILYEWIDDIDNQMIDAHPRDIPPLRAKKAMFYRYALLCYAKVNTLKRDEAFDICKLVVNAHNESVFHEVTEFDEQLTTLVNMCHNAMSEQIFLLRDAVAKDEYKMLSEAVQLILHETPLDLNWKPMECQSLFVSACYEARCKKGNLYNVNLFNGIVLYNGRPLSRLPVSILQHPLYVRSFEDRNFETCMSQNIVKTVRPVKGCVYEFGLHKEHLSVVERDIETDVELELLDAIELEEEEDSWGSGLPTILKENYSHWYCPVEQAILFRKLFFCDRDVEYILKYWDNTWYCYRIPAHQQHTVWNEYVHGSVDLEDFDYLVTANFPAMRVLEKFEDAQYIHTYKTMQEELKIEFPRFRMAFERHKQRDGSFCLKSNEYAGYILSPCQQLCDTLVHFTRYLVLQHEENGEENLKVIIPQGDVKKENGEVTVTVDENNNESDLKVYAYNIHPRLKSLQANSIGGRIHLAELYAATGLLLPEKRMQMTGEEVSLELLRRCWVNKPLSSKDYEKLQNLTKLSVHVPALRLMCYEVATSSTQNSHLHLDEYQNTNIPKIVYPSDAATEYLQSECPWNPKASLTNEEEIRILSHRRCGKTRKKNKCSSASVSKQDDLCKFYEDLLCSLLKEVKKPEEDFFMENDNVSTELHVFLMDALRESYDAFCKVMDTEVGNGFKDLFVYLSNDISLKRVSKERYLLDTISNINRSDIHGADEICVLRAANVFPYVSLEDLLRIACDESWIDVFNPYLSGKCTQTLKSNILLWLKLCVLEDKLKRLLRLCEEHDGDGRDHAVRLLIKKELSVHRNWSVEEHIDWLVFEVITQMQIRPAQYTIAQNMIDGIEEGLCPINQLNMGEGKTRVILPMLVLHWRRSNDVIRLNILSQLLSEAFDYMHRTLCASVLGVKVFTMPFSRDVDLSEANTQTMISSLKYCQQSRGLLLVAPEHRQSIQLKWYELKAQGLKGICRNLEELGDFDYLDILDESDEILRIKYKLIYACGNQEALPSGESRWNVMQALLKALNGSSLMQDLLSRPMVVQKEYDGISSSEKFQEFRILPGGAFDEIRTLFIETLIRELITNPPYELRWLKNLNDQVDHVVQYVTDAHDEEFFFAKIDLENFDDKRREDILALRGFLGNDIFIHCFTKRNRVDYGINRRSKRKSMAVPFRACETPALRAEFGHPDCALLYTNLSYYYDGLSEEQIFEAFKTLLKLGENSQAAIYDEWYNLSKEEMVKERCEGKLDTITKIDLTNSIMLSMLEKYFKFNMATINFWLNTNVFPVETMQFPNRLEATAWDLATNSQQQVAGFSGTNDERVIMPSILNWVEQDDLVLAGTDGKMLHLINKNTKFESLQSSSSEHQDDHSQWKTLLDLVVRESEESSYRTCALIDAGALMAGAGNTEVISYLISHLDGKRYQAVFYFHISKNEWWVQDKFGRSWPKHSSPINEQDGFVYFDESRCRGADMKLYLDSHAVLTLGPNMCKDKLTQAAGRMRLLEEGQQILLVAARDVTLQIGVANDIETDQITAVHVLQWATGNTVDNISKWLPEWAFQGGQYVVKEANPTLALVADMKTLRDMYGHEVVEQSVCEAWYQQRSSFLKQCREEDLSPQALGILDTIDDSIEEYGSDLNTVVASLEEEYERELEMELETEKVEELQVCSMEAREEKPWDVIQLLDVHRPMEISGIEVSSLKKFINKNIYFEGKPMHQQKTSISWPPEIYGTENFFYACGERYTRSSLNDYLRLIDYFVVFSNGQILLLSEREADEVLQLTWKNTSNKNFVLVNLTYSRQAYKTNTIKLQSPKTGMDVLQNLHDDVIAALQLFHGEVMYFTEEGRDAVDNMLNNGLAKRFAPMFSVMRGKRCTYQRSDLENICMSGPD